MKTVAARRVEPVDVPAPTPGPGQALVRIEHATLCGTDLHIWEDDYTTDLPLIQGHELCGTIVALGPEQAGTQPGATDAEAAAGDAGTPPAAASAATGIAPAALPGIGDRVAIDPLDTCGTCGACRRGRGNVCPHLTVLGCYGDGGLTELVAVPRHRLHRLPAGLPAELGPVAEPTSIALEAVRRGSASAGDVVLVLGCGPIGLLATLALHDLGATVVAADTVASRAELATRFGAAHALCIDPTAPFPLSRLQTLIGRAAPDGPDLVIEATGVPASLTNAITAVAPAGRVVQVGISNRPTAFPLNLLPFKEIDLLGSRNSQGLIPDALALIDRHRDTVRSLMTHRFDLENIQEAFATLADPQAGVGKILIDFPAVPTGAAEAQAGALA